MRCSGSNDPGSGSGPLTGHSAESAADSWYLTSFTAALGAAFLRAVAPGGFPAAEVSASAEPAAAACTESARTESARTESARTESARTESARAESAANFARTRRGSGSIRIGCGTHVSAAALSFAGSGDGAAPSMERVVAGCESAWERQPLTPAPARRASVISAVERTRANLMRTESTMYSKAVRMRRAPQASAPGGLGAPRSQLS